MASPSQPPPQPAASPSPSQPPPQPAASPSPSQPPPLPPQPGRRRIIRDYISHPLFVAIITLVLTLGVQWALGPHDEGTITYLMDQEVQIATTHTGFLASIYDAQAVVMDAGCQTPSQGTVWSGLMQITNRYNNLGQFTALEHFDPTISWVPNSWLATKAYVSATTVGGTVSGGPIHGNEHWTFAKINGQWLITLFVYNLC